jgi:hypothetical protein
LHKSKGTYLFVGYRAFYICYGNALLPCDAENLNFRRGGSYGHGAALRYALLGAVFKRKNDEDKDYLRRHD